MLNFPFPDIILGFRDDAAFSFDEGVGILSDIFSVNSFNDTIMSQQIISVIITIFVDSSPRVATPGQHHIIIICGKICDISHYRH